MTKLKVGDRVTLSGVVTRIDEEDKGGLPNEYVVRHINGVRIEILCNDEEDDYQIIAYDNDDGSVLAIEFSDNADHAFKVMDGYERIARKKRDGS